ncbi:LysR family transcriptional regulator, partial [Eisenbergiella porci]
MTLQQLRYVVAVAETGTITETADKLFLSQPSLTNAIRELEKEMKIQIFHRTK